MNKKLVLIITSVVVAVAIICCGALLIIKNVGNTVLSLNSKTALAGDTVELTLSIDKNHGIWGGPIVINYDAESISFVSCANGGVFDECEVNSNEGEVVLLVTQSDFENTKANGVVATLNFKVKVSAEKGDFDISFNGESNLCNIDEEIVEINYNNGKIKVK